MAGAEALVRSLERRGVEHIFGLCGHSNVAVLAALASSRIRFIGVHHEQMASHAADGWARLTGRPGVVLTHLGPGLTNALTGVANASLDAVPMVVISGNVQSYFFGRHAHMETLLHGDANQAESFQPFCKRVWRIDRSEALLPAVDAAFRTAISGRPGPVLLDVAMDVFSLPTAYDAASGLSVAPSPPALDPALADRIAEALLSAERPVIYAGGGVNQSGGATELRRLAELVNAPVAYSLMGKGAMPDSHPLTVGMSGFWGTIGANTACREADVLLAVGSSFSELDASSWQPGTTFNFPPTRLIHLHSDASEIGRSYVPEIGAVSDSRLGLAAIIGAAEARAPRRTTFTLSAKLADLKTSFDQSLQAARLSEQFPIRPERVLAEVRRALPEHGVLVGDTGWNKNGVGQQFRIDPPGRFVAPGAFATMGFGPAAALGAALAEPGRPLVALVGDGAFLTNLSVVVTAVEERLPVVWAVMNNGTYATISGMERRHFGLDYGSVFDASKLDYAAFARSVGAKGARVESPSQLAAVLVAAIAAREPYVVDIPCTQDAVPVTGHWDINTLLGHVRD